MHHIHISLSGPEDYGAIVSNTITFSPGETSATVSVTIVDDDVLEGVEQLSVEVVATEGQERVDVGDTANIFIYNDDCEKTYSSNAFLHVCLPHLPFCLCTSLSVCVCVCDSVSLCVSLLVFQSACQSVCLSVCVITPQ